MALGRGGKGKGQDALRMGVILREGNAMGCLEVGKGGGWIWGEASRAYSAAVGGRL